MKQKDIEVGKTYVNKGKGKTARKVIEISMYLECPWFSSKSPPVDEPVVKYLDLISGRERTLYLRSFASWCGRELEGVK